MSNIDKQAVQAVADLKAGYTLGHADVAILNELARIALASHEAEPDYIRYDCGCCGWETLEEWRDNDVCPKCNHNPMGKTELFSAPPAPVSVPDEWKQWIADAVEYLEGGLEADGELEAEGSIEAKRLLSRRAAMLQGADRPQNEPQNIPENIPATQFKPVADLYGLTSPTGGETSFTFDAVEARDLVDGGWSCQEYVELERFQEAVSGNSPVIPDGWVACSERMPEQFKAILAFNEYGEVWSGAYDRCWNFYCDNLLVEHVTHWMPLPAAPQQEA